MNCKRRIFLILVYLCLKHRLFDDPSALFLWMELNREKQKGRTSRDNYCPFFLVRTGRNIRKSTIFYWISELFNPVACYRFLPTHLPKFGIPVCFCFWFPFSCNPDTKKHCKCVKVRGTTYLTFYVWNNHLLQRRMNWLPVFKSSASCYWCRMLYFFFRQQQGVQPQTPPPQQRGGRSGGGGGGSSSGGRRGTGSDNGRGRSRYNPY